MAIRAAQAGNTTAARVMFRKVLSEDKTNERAMMWMAKITTDNKAERKKWLERVLEVNPDNQQAKDALKKIVYKKTANENRTLLLFGVVAGVLIVLAIVVVAGILIFNR